MLRIQSVLVGAWRDHQLDLNNYPHRRFPPEMSDSHCRVHQSWFYWWLLFVSVADIHSSDWMTSWLWISSNDRKMKCEYSVLNNEHWSAVISIVKIVRLHHVRYTMDGQDVEEVIGARTDLKEHCFAKIRYYTCETLLDTLFSMFHSPTNHSTFSQLSFQCTY